MTPAMLPPARPAWPKERVAEIINAAGITAAVVIFAARGFYRDSMGAPGRNDFGIYDDAAYVYSPHALVAFNFNTDPSRGGFNAKVGKPMAVLKPGTYTYQIGMHKAGRPGAHRALIQAGPVTVLRGAAEEAGWFGINIHRGGTTTTSSEGCQTVPPSQWDAFLALVESEMRRAGVRTVAYHLREQQG